jgi:hypothetical protein
MHEHGNSDSPVVPMKSPNKAMAAAIGAEVVEERGWPRGTRTAQHVLDTVPGQTCQTGWIVCVK